VVSRERLDTQINVTKTKQIRIPLIVSGITPTNLVFFCGKVEKIEETLET
jgi:hypothetical protein